MIELTSIRRLAETIPRIPQEVASVVQMDSLSANGGFEDALASLARRGYIGCVPISHDFGNHVVVRLVPERPLPECPVADTWGSMTEAMTIAPNIRYLVAGRMAQLDAASPDKSLTAAEAAFLEEFAAQFGDREGVRRVIAAIPLARGHEEYQMRCSVLWGAIDPELPWYRVMEGAWSKCRKDLHPWIDEAMAAFPDEPIVQRLYVAHHVRYATGVDVTSTAWKVIEGDAPFDPNYMGIILGPAMGVWDQNALALSVEWLATRGLPDLTDSRALLWSAAREFAADPGTYDGSRHLQAAERIAPDDAKMAYSQIVTAAACMARAKRRAPVDAIRLSHQLAMASHWKDLSETLTIAASKLRINL